MLHMLKNEWNPPNVVQRNCNTGSEAAAINSKWNIPDGDVDRDG